METYFFGVLKALLAFVVILILARWLNKEQLSQLTFYDWIVGITIGSMAANLTNEPEGRILEHVVILVVFSAAAYLTGMMTVKSRPLRKLIEGEPTVVIHNGRILEHNMAKLHYNVDNLLNQLREKNVFNIEDVEFALLEGNGGLSVLLKSQKRPLTPSDLGIPTSYEGLSSEIIVDGQVIYQNLKQNNLDEQWLIAELRKRGYNSPRDIVLATLSSDGELYIDNKKDGTEHMVDVSD
ncbi:MAG: DUF421 domain-containing protein [Syntrophomonadaceae bacterium]|nr:DUF421 domain-containing protein [Syntrophomonadaceae bacterium]